MKRIALTLAALLLVSCGGKSTPTAPSTPTPTPTVTKIINVFGSMNYGGVGLNSSKTNKMTIQNQGNALLTVTSITAPTSVVNVTSVSWTSGTIPPGANQDVSITFTPTTVTNYSGTITVNGDQTSGTNTITFSGNGTLDGIPIFSKSGKGDTVFNIPAYVTRLRAQGHFVDTGSTSNFAVRAGGSLIVNEILRNADYDGTHVVTGGALIEIISSASIQWTFTEVRQ